MHFKLDSLQRTLKNVGGQPFVRTPSVWLSPNNSAPHVRFSTNVNWNAGIDSANGGLSLNQWYYLAYTLSDPEKRLDFYIDGQWVGFQSIQKVQAEYVIFNDGPLYIGKDFDSTSVGMTGQIRYGWLIQECRN